MTNEQKALNYYRCATEKRRPDYVPSRVRLVERVRGDGAFRSTIADAGEHDCECNQWGAVSVLARDGSMLGLRPAEFEPIEWRHNTVIA